jgi:hypothetical protein
MHYPAYDNAGGIILGLAACHHAYGGRRRFRKGPARALQASSDFVSRSWEASAIGLAACVWLGSPGTASGVRSASRQAGHEKSRP